MRTEASKEHDWLRQLVGEWTFEWSSFAAPGMPATKQAGTVSARALGDLWVLCEGRSEGADGGTDLTQMMLGYDPAKERFVGTYIGSMMAHMWVYEGTLDPSGTTLTLDCEGPGFAPGSGMAKYKDVIEVKGADHWVLTSSVRGDDGTWSQFMSAPHHRVK